MSRLLVSAAHKSSGKTTVSLGLCAALRERGHAVQPFKKGPDYIDPMWLSAAAGRACRNLDPYIQGEAGLALFFRRHQRPGEFALIEGNKGLYDGLDADGGDSSAALAKLLRAPVLLVVDCSGMTRGVAPLLLGYRQFDPAVTFAGVVLNKVSGTRHEAKLRAAVERHTDLPVLGAVQRSAELVIGERHLGLVPTHETQAADTRIVAIARAIAAQVDLDRVAAAAEVAPALPDGPAVVATGGVARSGRVGVAMDAAFRFYYPEDLEALEAEGFAIVPFDTTTDSRLPEGLDGLFLGGGFPETQMEALAANAELRADIRAAAAAGLPIYAECGGMMYLARSLTWQGVTLPMVGALPADAVMHDRPQGRGYVTVRETAAFPWPGAQPGGSLRGHEFHYASLENIAPEVTYAYEVTRGHGIDGRRDGIVWGNILAAFTHRRGVGADAWPRRFAAFLRARSENRRHPSDAAIVRPHQAAGTTSHNHFQEFRCHV